jgi:hypothetical protein
LGLWFPTLSQNTRQDGAPIYVMGPAIEEF